MRKIYFEVKDMKEILTGGKEEEGKKRNPSGGHGSRYET